MPADDHLRMREELVELLDLSELLDLPVRQLNLGQRMRCDLAATLQADMLLVYTLDTHVYVGDVASPVDVVTLEFLPHKQDRVTTTASAALLDTRNGYVYGIAEVNARHDQTANAWTSEQAVDHF